LNEEDQVYLINLYIHHLLFALNHISKMEKVNGLKIELLVNF
jgi:hypothetical protein